MYRVVSEHRHTSYQKSETVHPDTTASGMTGTKYRPYRKVSAIRGRASVRKGVIGVQVLVVFSFVGCVARSRLSTPQSIVDKEVRLPKYLRCPSAQHLTTGTWIVERKYKFTRWEPLECFISTYDVGSTRSALKVTRPVFVSNSEGVDTFDLVCDFGKISCHEEPYIASHVSLLSALKNPDLLRDKIVNTRATVLLIFNAEATGELCSLISSQRANGFDGKVLLVASSPATEAISVSDYNLKCFKSENSSGLEAVDFSELLRKHQKASKSLCLEKSNTVQTSTILRKAPYESDRDCRALLEKQLSAVVAQILLSAIDMYSRQSHSTFGIHHSGSCAVVSSAGYLLKYNLGPEIDGADFVIRTSVAPSKGFEEFVGSRTDLRILRNSAFDSERVNYEPEGEENVIVVHDLVPNTTSPMEKFSNRFILARQSVPYINFRRPVRKGGFQYSTLGRCLMGSRDISTGMWSIYLLYHQKLCTEIKLYGFLGQKHLDEPYHYFASSSHEDLQHSTRIHYESRKHMKGGHDFVREQKCMKDMVARRDKIVSIF